MEAGAQSLCFISLCPGTPPSSSLNNNNNKNQDNKESVTVRSDIVRFGPSEISNRKGSPFDAKVFSGREMDGIEIDMMRPIDP